MATRCVYSNTAGRILRLHPPDTPRSRVCGAARGGVHKPAWNPLRSGRVQDMSTDVIRREIIARNLTRIRERIASACAKAGRTTDSVELVAVTKYAPEAAIRGLLELGVSQLGENRVQQLTKRAAALGAAGCGLGEAPRDPSAPNWHMIGHLQRNKVRDLLKLCRIVHSLDSIRLAHALSAEAEESGTRVDVLVEVNLSGEAAKTGIAAAEVEPLIEAVRESPSLRLAGLMTMAALAPDAAQSRATFAALRALLETLRERRMVPTACDQLSMGMSHDLEYAIAEGATIVRVGSSLFEGL